ncbi:guanine deaminase [Scopulibacillus darangshiensis]|uniref:Guanine deaminase n=1 Tax=Scopulibacillus darangshiensis TaxID=442528 RepID=A0A4R2NPP9_9BACL|nr:guanine deaminase [Scopulibacillus darangshiensis]
MALESVEKGGRPFACIVARDGEIIAESPNLVEQTQDPTAHAEVMAIRKACMTLKTEHLTGCDIYILASPCPMCLGALYYCSPDRVIYITTREEYSSYYKDNRKYFELETFYSEYGKPAEERRLPMIHKPNGESINVYKRWEQLNRA